MSLSFSENKNKLFGRSTLWHKNDDTDIQDFYGSGYPRKLYVELSSRCNLRCNHCYRAFLPPDHGDIMPLEMIDTIVKDFFGKITAMRVGGVSYGEPMISPHFNYFLNKLKGYPIDVELITNGTLITKNNAQLIADTVSSVYISMEGIGGHYESSRGWRWDKIENVIDLLVEERNKIKKERNLKICFAITIKREFREDYPKIIEFAKKHCMDLLLMRNFIPRVDSETKSSLLYFEKEHNVFFDEIEKYANRHGIAVILPSLIPLERSKRNLFRRESCSQPFELFGIMPDGKIIPCCLMPSDLGYYFPGERIVMERWTSKEFVHLRKTVNSDHPLPVCKTCELTNYNPLAYRPPDKVQKFFAVLTKYDFLGTIKILKGIRRSVSALVN